MARTYVPVVYDTNVVSNQNVRVCPRPGLTKGAIHTFNRRLRKKRHKMVVRFASHLEVPRPLKDSFIWKLV